MGDYKSYGCLLNRLTAGLYQGMVHFLPLSKNSEASDERCFLDAPLLDAHTALASWSMVTQRWTLIFSFLFSDLELSSRLLECITSHSVDEEVFVLMF